MKLNESHIGKRMTDDIWSKHDYFVPTHLDKKGNWQGYDQDGEPDSWYKEDDGWKFWRETDEMERIAPMEEGLSFADLANVIVPFRRIDDLNGDKAWMRWQGAFLVWEMNGERVGVTRSDLKARYELKPEPKKVEVTSAMIYSAYSSLLKEYPDRRPPLGECIDIVIKKLGL